MPLPKQPDIYVPEEKSDQENHSAGEHQPYRGDAAEEEQDEEDEQ